MAQGDFQHPVSLPVVVEALRSRQHRGVIRHYDATRRVRAKLAAVDTAYPGNHPVGGRVPDQVLQRAPATLGGHGQGAIFGKAVGITEVSDVLASGAHPQRAPFGNGLGAHVVRQECKPVAHRLKIGAHRPVRAGGVRSRHRRLVMRRVQFLQAEQFLALGDQVGHLHVDGDDPRGLVGANLVKHFHGVDNEQHRVGRHGLPRRHEQFCNRPS